MSKPVLNVEDIMKLFDKSRSWVYRVIDTEDFPRPFRPGMWRRSEIDYWISCERPARAQNHPD